MNSSNHLSYGSVLAVSIKLATNGHFEMAIAHSHWSMTTEQWKKSWWWVREQHQWQLLREQKLWGTATSAPLTVHPFSHSAAKLHLPRFIAESGAEKHLVAWLWRGAHTVPKNYWEENNHHFLPCMALRNGAILQQPLFIPTGALGSHV